MLEWDRYGFQKKCVGTRYAKLVYILAFGYAGHVLHSSASGSRNIDALFFMLGWDRYGFDQKRVSTCYAELLFLHPVEFVGHVVHSAASGRVILTNYF
jgi:hypothetical protein